MGKTKKVKAIYSIFAICLIVLGTVLLLRPQIAMNVFCDICGILLLLFGIVKLFGYFSKDLLQLAFQFDFALGIISMLIGVLMIFRSEQFMDILINGIGLFMLADALLRVQTAMDAKRIGVRYWWIILLIALVTAVIGAILFIRAYLGKIVITRLIGLNLVIDGILNLFTVQSTVTIIRRKNEWEA